MVKYDYKKKAYVFTFGRYKSIPVKDVIEMHPDYIRWIFEESDIAEWNPDALKIIQKIAGQKKSEADWRWIFRR